MLGKLLRNVARHEGANVGVIFGISLFPMIGLMGIGIDYSRAIAVKTKLDATADAAALAAATEAMALMNQFSGQSYAVATAQQYGAYAGQQMFTTDSAKIVPQLTATPTPTVTVSAPSNGVITANVTYQVALKNVFTSIIGAPTTTISGASAANLKMPTYTNISIAIDTSQSMGLAATTSGMTQLMGLTQSTSEDPNGCAFGCHVVASEQGNSSSTYYQQNAYESIAENANPPIQLRIDVIRSATETMISNAQTSNPGLISFGLYTVQNGLTTVYSPPANPPQAADYTAMYNAAKSIDLDSSTTGGGPGDTYFNGTSSAQGALAKLTAKVPASGDGTTYAKANQFVFIMTDGVEDEVAPGSSCPTGSNESWTGPWGGHCTQPLDYSQCAAMKNAGITVGVIYTTYLNMSGDDRYDALIGPFANKIAFNLQSCATSGWYYQANDATGIQTAMNALFQKATGSGVLVK